MGLSTYTRTANMPICDARVQAFFAAAAEVGFSVTCQLAPFEGENYGLVEAEIGEAWVFVV